MFEKVLEEFPGYTDRLDTQAIQQAFTSAPLTVVQSGVRSDRMIVTPLELLKTIPDDAILYVICESRYSAKATYEDIDQYAHTEALGVLFRARLSMEEVSHPDNRIVYVSADYVARTNLITTIRYAVLEYGEITSSPMIACLSKLRKRIDAGEDVHLCLTVLQPLTDTRIWTQLGLTPTTIVSTPVVQEQDEAPEPMPDETTALYASRLVRLGKSKIIVIMCHSKYMAEEVYGDFVNLAIQGMLPTGTQLQILPKQIPVHLKQSLKEPSGPDSPVRILMVVGSPSGLPYIPNLDTVITSGLEKESHYSDLNRRSVQVRPMNRETLLKQKSILPGGKGRFFDMCQDPPCESRLPAFLPMYLCVYMALLSLSESDIVTGYGLPLKTKLNRASAQLQQFGMIAKDSDGCLSQTLDGMMALGELNLAVRAAVALAQAIREDILPIAFPYIALLAKCTLGHLGFKVPNVQYTLCQTSDPINAIATLLTEAHHQSKDGSVDYALMHIDRVRRVVEPKGFGVTFDLDAWVSKDRKTPPRVIADPVLFKKMKSVILRAHCDQLYAVDGQRLVLSFDDSVVFSTKSSVVTPRNAIAAAALLTPIVTDGDKSFVVARNITTYTEEEFNYASKWYPPERGALLSTFPRCDWEYIEDKLRVGWQ